MKIEDALQRFQELAGKQYSSFQTDFVKNADGVETVSFRFYTNNESSLAHGEVDLDSAMSKVESAFAKSALREVVSAHERAAEITKILSERTNAR